MQGIESFANMDSGAAIMRFPDDGSEPDFVAISEERLIRTKHPYAFPTFSIGYCVNHYESENLSDIDLIVDGNGTNLQTASFLDADKQRHQRPTVVPTALGRR